MTRVFRTVRKRAFIVALAGAISASLALTGCGRIGETNVHGIVVTPSMLESVKPGTTQQQVVDALGSPSTTSTINGEAFYYISQTTNRPVAFMHPREVDRTVFVVYFNNDRVTRLAHYGIQDGRVFDYITRTTPTAGADQGFVTQLIRGVTAGVPGFSR